MKILEIIPQLASGGAERFVVDLSNELSRQHEIYLATFFEGETSNFYKPDLFPEVKHIIMGKKTGLSLGFFFKISSLISKISPDIIHIHLAAINYVFPYLLLHRNVKCFMTIHSDAFKETDGKIGHIARNFCFKNRYITPITISYGSQHSFKECYKMDASLIFNGRMIPDNFTVSHSVQEEFKLYKKTSKTKVLINLARFSSIKRQPLIAKCVKRLCNEGFDFTFLMIGQTRDVDILNGVLENKCEALYILGEKSNPLEYLKLADAYCLFSSYEGMPISLIEAFASSTVPLCTPVGGIVDIIKNGVNGLLSKDLSEDAVYNTMKEFLLLDESSLSSLKDNALKSFGKYSIEETAKQYLSLFKS